MSAPKPKDDDDPPIVLVPNAPPVPPPPPSPPHVTAVIDDTPALNPPPPPPRAHAEYTTDLPSIATDRVRDPSLFPPTAIKRPPSPWVRRAALVAAGAALALGVWGAIAAMRPEPPVITSVTPSKAEPGQTVTIAGRALGTDPGDLVVRFGDRRGPVTSADGASLSATVPAELANMPPGPIRVTVDAGGVASNALFMVIARYPKITGVRPEVALPGTEVVISGAHLQGDSVGVRIGGFPAEVVGRGGEGLRVKVPQMPVVEGKAVSVDVHLGEENARPGTLVLGHLPLVTGVTPATGEVGTTVRIAGYGFAPAPAGNRVTFGDLEALVLAASEREIQAVVPASGILGSRTSLRGMVATGNARSAPFEFTAVRASGEVFRPRFVAARVPAGDTAEQAMVATELGGLLVLTGRADAPSAGERAVRAAAHLNALLQAAAGRAVAIEVKENPLRIVSGATTIVAVTPEDAQGLSRGSEGVRVTPPALAGYWAALLSDYVGLFGQRIRPNRSVDLTPRARALLDLYSDAERTGGSAGVSARIIMGLGPERLEAIRKLAYPGPRDGAPPGGIALAGAWEGTLDEAGRSRAIRLQVRSDAGRLGGNLTSTAGKVAMGIPLRDLSYDKGMVRFSASLGGAPVQFRGALDGATLSGTTHAEGSPNPSGRFTLRHVE